jgi:hypothetical protein
MDDPLEAKELQIRRRRASAALSAISWTVGSAQLLFWAFALGAAFGPAPLVIGELIAGALFSMAMGLTIASLAVRRRLDGDALVAARVGEGGRKKRLVVFADHLILDDEVIARERLEKARLNEEMELELRVSRPDGFKQRTFSGSRAMLARVRDELNSLVTP